MFPLFQTGKHTQKSLEGSAESYQIAHRNDWHPIPFGPKTVIRGSVLNNRQLARKYRRIFVFGRYLFREANSFPRAKRVNSVNSFKTISRLFKTITSIQFERKTERVNAECKFWKLGNITWELSPDVPQFRLRHMMFWNNRAQEKYLIDHNQVHFVCTPNWRNVAGKKHKP